MQYTQLTDDQRRALLKDRLLNLEVEHFNNATSAQLAVKRPDADTDAARAELALFVANVDVIEALHAELSDQLAALPVPAPPVIDEAEAKRQAELEAARVAHDAMVRKAEDELIAQMAAAADPAPAP